MESKNLLVTVQQYQRFRFKNEVRNVPTHSINGKSFVFLDEIQNIFRCKIGDFTVNNNPLAFVRNQLGEHEKPLRIRADMTEIIDCDEVQQSAVPQNTDDKLERLMEEVNRLREVLNHTLENIKELKIKVDAIRQQSI